MQLQKQERLPIHGNCQTSDTIYKCIASITVNPGKVYLGTAEGNFEKRNYNHKTLFNSRKNANDIALSKHAWEVKDKQKETPYFKQSIVKSVPGYSNVTKKRLLCLHERLEIINLVCFKLVPQLRSSYFTSFLCAMDHL